MSTVNSVSGPRQRRRHIAEAEALSDKVAITAGGGHAHAALASEDRLAALYVRIAGVEAEVDQLQGAVPLLKGRFPADEIALVELDEALHGRVDHGDFVGQFRAPASVGLFQPQAVDRVEAEIADAEVRPACISASYRGSMNSIAGCSSHPSSPT